MRLHVIIVSALALTGCGPKPPVAMPSDDVPVGVGAVAPLALIINELKCDYNDWLKADVPNRDRLVLGKVTGTLKLSLVRDYTDKAGLGVAIALGPISINPGVSASTTTKVENALDIPFEMSTEVEGKAANAITGAQCSPEHRLSSPILALEALGRQLSNAPSGSPFFRLSDDLKYTGQFYLQKDTEFKAKVVLLPFTIDPGSLGRSAKFIQSFEIKVNVTGSEPALIKPEGVQKPSAKSAQRKQKPSDWFKGQPAGLPRLDGPQRPLSGQPDASIDPSKQTDVAPKLPTVIEFDDGGSVTTPQT